MPARAKERPSVLERGLPANPDAERFILGSILLDGSKFAEVSGDLKESDFALEKHRRIWARLHGLFEAGAPIDRVSVANELLRHDELESVDGLSYLVSLDDGLPQLANLGGFVSIVLECSRGRRLASLGQRIFDQAILKATSEDIVQSAFADLMAIEDVRKKGFLRISGSVIEEYPGGVNGFLSPNSGRVGLKTGFVKFDDMTGGLHDGELVILAARPSMGKTALAIQMGMYVARRGTPAAVFSLEMSAESLLQRAICSQARVDSHRWRSGWLNEGERRSLRKATSIVHGAPLHIDDTARISLPEVYSKIRKTNAERQSVGLRPIGLVIVDYLQLMEVSGGPGRSRNDDVSALSRGLKLLARELDIPVIALSQLSRASETRQGDFRPRMGDLRDSGAIEQDADVIGFIHRPEVYQRDREDLKGVAELLLAKQRNGPIGKVDLVFIHSQVRFENRAEDLGEIGEDVEGDAE